MRIIALEEHWWTQDLFQTLRTMPAGTRDAGLDFFELDLFAGRNIESSLEELADDRLAAMDEMGVDVQILSVGPPATQSMPAAQARSMARDLNDRAAAAIRAHPDRFAAFATLGFDPVVDLVLAAGGWGWHMETRLAALRLILRGTFDRHPTLKLVLGHWGEMLPFWIERVDALLSRPNLDRRIIDYVRDNLYLTPSGMFHQHLLQRALDLVGPEHILFSVDYPFHLPTGGDARRFLHDADLSTEHKQLIAHQNAERILHHPSAETAGQGHW
ncbi:amidohydrolase family protein [Actinoplanes sp. NPDC049265]|uniref:amidohydrolase family protein n=1 Tax=Actinoplanes sp. NPDC049265 TaxID=3363902 RepID=UPI0037112C46